MSKFTVTLADLRKAGACLSGYNKVVRSLQGKKFTDDDAELESYIRFNHKEPIAIPAIIKSNGLDDALWALRCVKNTDRDLRLYAVWCARQVEHLMTDRSSKHALDVAERHANGLATDDELAAAWAAAWAAARAAATDEARGAAWAAAWAAATDETCGAACGAAWAAARAAARAAATDETCGAQKEMLIKMCNGEAPWQK